MSGKRARERNRTEQGTKIAAFVVLCFVSGCDVQAIEECHDLMQSSQQVMLKMDSSEIAEVEKSLQAVDSALQACKKANRADEVTKVEDAHRQLSAQAKGLRAQAERKKRPKLSDAQLTALQKSGDPSCPKGQQYEHHQNKALIDCTGPQLVDMNWTQASEYFERRGYSQHLEGARLRFESGVERYDFDFASVDSAKAPQCFSVVAKPGVPWQEIVTRATGVHPQKLKLEKPVITKRGPLDLLVEGSSEQYTVKLGKCDATRGQSAVKSPE